MTRPLGPPSDPRKIAKLGSKISSLQRRGNNPFKYAAPVAPADTPLDYVDGDPENTTFTAGLWGGIAGYPALGYRLNNDGLEFTAAGLTGGEASPGSEVCTLPAAFWPSEAFQVISTIGDGSQIGTFEMQTDGKFVFLQITGEPGADGAPGAGVAVGGATGQVLKKNSGTDYDTGWATPHYVPAGGATGQALEKNSGTDYDTVWATVHQPPAGGATGQVLEKNSGTDYDYSWLTPSAGGSGWHDGSGAPSGGLGVNGDYYIDDDTGDIYLKASGSWSKVAPGARVGDLIVVIQGNGSVITTGVKADVAIDFNCQIVGWTLLADLSGSIQLDIWKDVYANYPPTIADTITASAKPLISSALKNKDTTLTGWTTAITAGDTLRINVDSITTITRAMLALKLKRT